ncbi:MAG: sigma-70 family RNA polymerase sigma factor [Paludibacter sp.]|jgi:RNA polymerase sigma-70 factor (ECF subfamily)|nr:sigma-70 family RNA polymerase sigma factor [Paludibacter sp.]
MNFPDTELQIMLTDPDKRSDAFSRVVRLYQERIYWHIRKMVLLHDDANDVMQNTFLKAWNGLDGFRGDSQISTWLYRIATNETLTFLANKKAKAALSVDAVDLNVANYLRADAYFDGDELQADLQQAIATLPEKQRLVFNMRYYEEMPYEEMEEILGTSVGALKASYHHAVKKIEKRFEIERN